MLDSNKKIYECLVINSELDDSNTDIKDKEKVMSIADKIVRMLAKDRHFLASYREPVAVEYEDIIECRENYR